MVTVYPPIGEREKALPSIYLSIGSLFYLPKK
jgi:hypothetical protein